ncbi:hypothetical protein NCAS_0B08520 [Naumovozyma castellii]|uniref:Ribokinase n=1 Tax=Naumovozyma castellii TaxID=27288 RepID=G0VAR0_NAUCA|nr:hypothetical protein NCAS_0B08520 [Naumovozyma castellii CBS 4309]CCC68936.1 hypothetical protein NCAS_0B08520 [Naumovozyma castellii CBS 4309]
MGITVVGSLNYDLVTYTDRIPGPGETFRANRFETHAGGKGLNQTIATARMRDDDYNYPVRMVGNVGDDSFGEQLIKILRDNDVDVSQVGSLPGVETGVATIIVEEKEGQNRIIITAGANGKTTFTNEQLNRIFPEISGQEKEVVVFQQEIPNPASVVHWLHENRSSHEIVFNPSPFQPLDEKDWELIDVLVVNEIEALQIVKTIYDEEQIKYYEERIAGDFVKGYEMICQEFQKNLVNQRKSAIVIITLGSKGALFCSKNHLKVGYVPAAKVKSVVDTTGAGDTFLGSIVTQLYQNQPLESAMTFSTKASSLAIQKRGAAESIPRFNDVLFSLQVKEKH